MGNSKTSEGIPEKLMLFSERDRVLFLEGYCKKKHASDERMIGTMTLNGAVICADAIIGRIKALYENGTHMEAVAGAALVTGKNPLQDAVTGMQPDKVIDRYIDRLAVYFPVPVTDKIWKDWIKLSMWECVMRCILRTKKTDSEWYVNSVEDIIDEFLYSLSKYRTWWMR